MKSCQDFKPSEAFSLRGEYVESEFAMEPPAVFGESPAYFIEAKLPDIPGGVISFESFEQMEEFSKHLAQYVEICRMTREKK